MDGTKSLQSYRKIESAFAATFLSGMILMVMGPLLISVCGGLLGIDSWWVLCPFMLGGIAMAFAGPAHSFSQDRLVKKAYDDLGFKAVCSNDGSMVVTKVVAGTGSFSAGLRSGDILVSIAGDAVGAGSGFDWKMADIYEKFLVRGSVDFVALRKGGSVATIEGVIEKS